jgi:excinuclease ABC subunit C
VKAAAGLADELVRPVPELRAVIVQAAGHDPALGSERAEEAAVFLLERGCLAGPERMSTLGVRAVREQTSVGSSLFAQPLMLQAVPLGPPVAGLASCVEGKEAPPIAAPEERVGRVLNILGEEIGAADDVAMLSDHLALLRRWYYRPEKQRAGEVFFPSADGSWPVRRVLRGAARTVIGEPKPMQETDREGAKALRTKVLHEGRPEVERVVPVVERAGAFRSRRRKSVVPGDVA